MGTDLWGENESHYTAGAGGDANSGHSHVLNFATRRPRIATPNPKSGDTLFGISHEALHGTKEGVMKSSRTASVVAVVLVSMTMTDGPPLAEVSAIRVGMSRAATGRG